MNKIFFAVVIALLLSSTLIFSQNKYKPLEEQDNVSFSYRWKPSKFLKKNSQPILMIKIRNNNTYAADISFTIDYFWDLVLKSSSEELSYCLKGNKSIVGKIKRFGFDTSDFTKDQLESEQFMVELNVLKITKEDCCKKEK